MESRVKILGHPIHPVLIVFPVGGLASAVIFDIVYLITRNTIFPTISFYDIIIGVIGGLLAALVGLIEWLGLPGKTRAKTVGLFHGLGNAVLVVLFIISWVIRLSSTGYIPPTVGYVLSFLGMGIGLVTSWLGGELVYRLDVAVDPGANLNAPSSLSRAPARAPGTAGSAGTPIPVTGEPEQPIEQAPEEHAPQEPDDPNQFN